MSARQKPAFVFERNVDFADTDAAGVVHFSNLFRYVEACEHAFLKSLAIPVLGGSDPAIAWPRVHAECTYHRPVRFGDVLRIALFVEKVGESSVTYRFVIANTREPVAEARLTAVHLEIRGSSAQKTPLPAAIRSALEARVADSPDSSPVNPPSV